MAKNTFNTEIPSWASLLHNHSVATKAWDLVRYDNQCPARAKIARAVLEAQSKLFANPAPSLGGVIKKLEIWWGEELFGDSDDSKFNRIVIGDLRRLDLEAAGATELEASGRSPEEAAEQLTEWQSNLADYAEQEKLFVEGPSPRWEGRDAAEIIDAMDYSAGVLFELPAPNLYGVIRKLELRWDDARFDEVGNAALYVQILRDLHRLAREHAAAMPESE